MESSIWPFIVVVLSEIGWSLVVFVVSVDIAEAAGRSMFLTGDVFGESALQLCELLLREAVSCSSINGPLCVCGSASSRFAVGVVVVSAVVFSSVGCVWASLSFLISASRVGVRTVSSATK